LKRTCILLNTHLNSKTQNVLFHSYDGYERSMLMVSIFNIFNPMLSESCPEIVSEHFCEKTQRIYRYTFSRLIFEGYVEHWTKKEVINPKTDLIEETFVYQG
jgi:hypothetical protein